MLYHHELRSRLKKELDRRSDEIKDRVMSGSMDQNAYRFECGKARGLAEALELFDLAVKSRGEDSEDEEGELR